MRNLRHRRVIEEQLPKIQSPSTEIRTVHWDDLPDWQRDNEYILTGYVPETNSWSKTIHSMLFWHNETVNVYSHLIPGLLCMLGVIFGHGKLLRPLATTTSADHAVATLFLAGAATCLAASSTFHCAKCHSPGVASFGNKLDYLGIVALVVSSTVSVLYYGFHDNTPYFLSSCTLTVGLGSLCALVSLRERFRTREWRPYRAGLFVAFGLSAVFPMIAAIRRYGIKEAATRVQLPWVGLEGVLYIGGAGLYGARFPEKWAPGKFDMLGHSHQWFHILVVLAALCHWRALLLSYEWAHSTLITNAMDLASSL